MHAASRCDLGSIPLNAVLDCARRLRKMFSKINVSFLVCSLRHLWQPPVQFCRLPRLLASLGGVTGVCVRLHRLLASLGGVTGVCARLPRLLVSLGGVTGVCALSSTCGMGLPCTAGRGKTAVDILFVRVRVCVGKPDAIVGYTE